MAADVRCSTWTRENHVDPIGTAGSYAGFALVEWPLPWPHDVSEIPELEAAARQAKASGHRVQAVTRGTPRAAGRRGRLAVVYRWDEGAGRFRGRETELPDDARGAGSALARWLEGTEPGDAHDAASIDVMLCGHGRRDRCCGSLGTALEAELRSAWQGRPGVRLWRTSHTGGHRFAPTAVVLPQGTMWGYLDRAAVEDVLDRRGPAAQRAHQYRGCAGLASPRIQAVEREVLDRIGWGLFDRPRTGVEGPDGAVRLSVGSGTEQRTWEGRVVVRRTLPVPDCGSPIGAARKSEDELEVVELREV